MLNKTKLLVKFQICAIAVEIQKNAQEGITTLLREALRNVAKLATKINPLLEMFEPRILKCDPKYKAQLIHGDNTSYVNETDDKENLNTMVISGLIAFDDNTNIDISTGTHIEKVKVSMWFSKRP